MIAYTWSILEVFGDQTIAKVRYLLKAEDESNTVETEGYHSYFEGSVCKPLSEIKEEDLIRWLDQDTTKDEINIIKLNLEKQLEALKTSKKIAFPWEADTFTIG
jgi:DNA replication protein DnaD